MRWILITFVVVFNLTMVALLITLIALPIIDRIRDTQRKKYHSSFYDNHENQMREVPE